MVRLSTMIMRRLYSTFWHRDRIITEEDLKHYKKVDDLQFVRPDQLDLPEASQTVNWTMWQLSIDQLRCMTKAKTPLQKQIALSKVFAII